MTNKKPLIKQINSFLYNHLWLKISLDYFWTFVMSLLSAVIFAFGFRVALSPAVANPFVSGGASGLSQVLSLITTIIFGEINMNQLYSVFYFAVNIPVAFIAFRFIGIRFGIFTVINVIGVTLCVDLVNFDFIDEISLFLIENGGMLTRVVFAGICSGLSSALSFKVETSAGGIDVISYWISLKKSTNVGKYNIIINAIIIIVFSLLKVVDGDAISEAVCSVFFSFLYLFLTSFIVDTINIRNKKVQVQIVTQLENLSSLLLINIPHGATVVKAKGAFSQQDKWIIYIDVSKKEANKVVQIATKLDPKVFIHITNLTQVYGRFFMKSVK